MTEAKSYTATAKWLHWGMALIWIAAWLVGLVAVHWRDEFNPQHQLTFLHKAMASTLIFLIVLRIAWRLTHAAPAMPDTMTPLVKRAAFIGHLLLYIVALVGLPISGWYWSSVADKPILVAGLFLLPPLVEPDKSLYDLAKAIHTYSAWLCGALVGGHMVVALKHHFIDKDKVLAGMLPGRVD
ncbi:MULTISPECIES: cytochrome b [Pseudomonas]|uniref:Cytochrome b n=1 Tax=Pseudomonas gessardii TaxID=78544 RepID=A0ABS9F622_9PSED|nr:MULTISPECIES: cytochrome b [Pseudomonas]MBH3423410.1 cytochrome b [Pseudomonas gessardii]MCF4980634.1 cytochrome b [Pseudomonas gessardii]MCF4991261.1 cytochrome b [Pseudomonas gessardii]MCF5087459.1 cytochrome b [Pseudomonas gessardii]MCF5095360.1 cytochrome b [Pseudomonas gessardii]